MDDLGVPLFLKTSTSQYRCFDVKVNTESEVVYQYPVSMLKFRGGYCWWLKSQTTSWDVQNPVNNGVNYQPQLVQDFSHQTVAGWNIPPFAIGKIHLQIKGSIFQPAMLVYWRVKLAPGRFRGWNFLPTDPPKKATSIFNGKLAHHGFQPFCTRQCGVAGFRPLLRFGILRGSLRPLNFKKMQKSHRIHGKIWEKR